MSDFLLRAAKSIMPFAAPIFVKNTFAEWLSSVFGFQLKSVRPALKMEKKFRG